MLTQGASGVSMFIHAATFGLRVAVLLLRWRKRGGRWFPALGVTRRWTWGIGLLMQVN